MKRLHLTAHLEARPGATSENDVRDPYMSPQVRKRNGLAKLIGQREITDLTQHRQRLAQKGAQPEIRQQKRQEYGGKNQRPNDPEYPNESSGRRIHQHEYFKPRSNFFSSLMATPKHGSLTPWLFMSTRL